MRLHDDALHDVFKFLDAEQLLNCIPLVCQRWYGVSSQDDLRWFAVCVKQWQLLDMDPSFLQPAPDSVSDADWEAGPWQRVFGFWSAQHRPWPPKQWVATPVGDCPLFGFPTDQIIMEVLCRDATGPHLLHSAQAFLAALNLKLHQQWGPAVPVPRAAPPPSPYPAPPLLALMAAVVVLLRVGGGLIRTEAVPLVGPSALSAITKTYALQPTAETIVAHYRDLVARYSEQEPSEANGSKSARGPDGRSGPPRLDCSMNAFLIEAQVLIRQDFAHASTWLQQQVGFLMQIDAVVSEVLQWLDGRHSVAPDATWHLGRWGIVAHGAAGAVVRPGAASAAKSTSRSAVPEAVLATSSEACGTSPPSDDPCLGTRHSATELGQLLHAMSWALTSLQTVPSFLALHSFRVSLRCALHALTAKVTHCVSLVKDKVVEAVERVLLEDIIDEHAQSESQLLFQLMDDYLIPMPKSASARSSPTGRVGASPL